MHFTGLVPIESAVYRKTPNRIPLASFLGPLKGFIWRWASFRDGLFYPDGFLLQIIVEKTKGGLFFTIKALKY